MSLAELAAAVRDGRTTSSALVAESLHRIETARRTDQRGGEN